LGMRIRFGDDKHTLIARIRHRRQAENESVQSYVDDMNMMFAQSAFPENWRRDMLLNNLKAGLRDDVIATIPATAEQVIANATYLEQKSAAVTPEKLKWERCMPNKQNAAERLTRSLENMSRCVANYWSRQEQEPEPGASQYFTREDHSQYRDPRCSAAPRRWRPARYAQQELDCAEADNSSRNGIDVFLHSAPSDMDISCSSEAGCIPSTPEALEYARSLDHRAEALEYARSLDHKAETVQAARIALAKCCTAVSGSGAVHTKARSIKAAKADEAMMNQEACIMTARPEQAVQGTEKALAKCCAVVSGNGAVHTEARSANATRAAMPVIVETKQAMPDTLANKICGTQAETGDSETTPSDLLQNVGTLGTAQEKSQNALGLTSAGSNNSRASGSGKDRKKAYASPFSFTFSKPISRTKVATALTIAPDAVKTAVSHCEMEAADVQADAQDCETVPGEAADMPTQAGTGNAILGLVETVDRKSEVPDTPDRGVCDQSEVAQQLVEEGTSVVMCFPSGSAEGLDPSSQSDTPLGFGSSTTTLGSISQHTDACNVYNVPEPSQIFCDANCDLAVTAHNVSVPDTVQIVFLSPLTNASSMQSRSVPLAVFTDNNCGQITGIAKSQTKQFDPGPAAAWSLKGVAAGRAEQDRQESRIYTEATVGLNRTMAGKLPHYVSKDPDKLHYSALSWRGVTSPW